MAPKKVNAYPVVIYKNNVGKEHRARITADNGNIIYNSTEFYSKKVDLDHSLRITYKSIGEYLDGLKKK